MKLNKLTIKQAQKKLENGEITSVELTKACLERIKEVDEKIKACLAVCEKDALAAAKEADQRRVKGENGELLGIPYVAKDNIMTKGIKTTAASKILKTYGRASRFGLIAMTSSTDIPGPLTKTVEDAGIVLSVIAGHDENDATTPDVKVNNYAISKPDIKDLTIGLPKEYFIKGINPGVREAVDKAVAEIKDLGAKVKEISLPHTKYGIPVYYIITPSEISSNLGRFDGIRYGFTAKEAKDLKEIYSKTRGQGFGAETKRRIMLGTYALSAGYYDAYYKQAQKVRTKIKDELDAALEEEDAIITPTQPDIAFKIGEKSDDPLQMYLVDIFVTSASLAGLPAISIPCGFSDKLPVGMQLIGKRFDEEMLFRIGHGYEQATDWHLQKSKV